MYSSRILRDSISPNGDRLSTFEVTFPRMILSEFNTHCVLSRNSASSRAVPVLKRVREALEVPFVPNEFGRNQPGMSAAETLSPDEHALARNIWLNARNGAAKATLDLIFGPDRLTVPSTNDPAFPDATLQALEASSDLDRELDVHKQIANRLLEPFLWHTAIATATDWSNFFALRANSAAQPEFRTIAIMMLDTMQASAPQELPAGTWHMPLILEDELPDAHSDADRWTNISAARCARVSYMTHDGVRDIEADLELAGRLLDDGHMSPFEHVARAMSVEEKSIQARAGKLLGWIPFRSLIPNEADFSLAGS